MSAAQADDQQLHTLAAAAATSTNSSSSLSSSTTDDSNDIRQRFARFVLAPRNNSTRGRAEVKGRPTTYLSRPHNRASETAASSVSSSSSSSSLPPRTAHDLPPLRICSLPSWLIQAEYFAVDTQSSDCVYVPLELKPQQEKVTRKEIQRFIKEVEHPLRYLEQPIKPQSAYDELQSIFLAATPLPSDLISLIREYRLEIQPFQSLLISAKFGPHHPDSRPFNTASIETSHAKVVNEHKRFDSEGNLKDIVSVVGWKYKSSKKIDKSIKEKNLEPEPSAAVNIIHSLPSILYSGKMIREIVGYYGCVKKVGPSCFGVKFVYGPQVELDREVDTRRLLADRPDLGFVMSSSLPNDPSSGRATYKRRSMRLYVNEYITCVTLQIGRYHFAVAVIFETNLNRRFYVGPESHNGAMLASDVTVEYIIDTPPDHALIALTGHEGDHLHAIRGVYAAIRKPQKQQEAYHD